MGSKLYVGNLGYNVTNSDLEQLCAPHGAVQSAEVIQDRDTGRSKGFGFVQMGSDEEAQGAIAALNVNAYVERFVQAIEQECLDKLIVFGPEHLDYVAAEYLAYYHEERPHQGKGNEPLIPTIATTDGEVVSRERLGGLLRHYYRKAA
jgi:RNA recognition motif-containing protein